MASLTPQDIRCIKSFLLIWEIVTERFCIEKSAIKDYIIKSEANRSLDSFKILTPGKPQALPSHFKIFLYNECFNLFLSSDQTTTLRQIIILNSA